MTKESKRSDYSRQEMANTLLKVESRYTSGNYSMTASKRTVEPKKFNQYNSGKANRLEGINISKGRNVGGT